MMNFYEIKGMLLNNQVTAFAAEKVMDLVDVCKFLITGAYAQEKEDLIVSRILTNIFHKKMSDITYLDIGANKWRHGNNTYLFYKKCRGILVEADPALAEKLRQKRKKDKVYNAAVGTKDGETLEFYILSLATRSSLDKKYIEQEEKRGIKVLNTIQIQCRTINSILEENNLVPDFLSIDIEGMDFQALQTIDYEKYKIKVIVAEQSDERNKDNETMDQFMLRKGYVVHNKTRSNVVYIRKKSKKSKEKLLL